MLDQHERIRTSAILTQSDVAHLIGVSPKIVKRWSARTTQRPALITQAPRGYGVTPPTIPLIGLSEATVLQLLSDRGVGPRKLAATVTRAKNSDPLTFARNDLYTDGTDFFRNVLGDLVRVRDGQFAIREAFGDFLKRVEFDSSGIMESYIVTSEKGVRTVIDPRYNSGRPILQRSGAPVFAVLGAIEAGENWQDIVDDYGVDLSEVRHVADHRERLAAVA